MSDACVIAAGAVSALGLGPDAYRVPAPGEPAPVAISSDAELSAAGLLRPYAGRAPVELGVSSSADRATDLLTAALQPIARAIQFPPELLPLAFLRSLTGSGSLAFATDLVKTHGPDSLIGRTASVMYGSSETTFYVLAVYFGAVGVRRTRHAVPAALIGDAVAVIASVIVCRWLF